MLMDGWISKWMGGDIDGWIDDDSMNSMIWYGWWWHVISSQDRFNEQIYMLNFSCHMMYRWCIVYRDNYIRTPLASSSPSLPSSLWTHGGKGKAVSEAQPQESDQAADREDLLTAFHHVIHHMRCCDVPMHHHHSCHHNHEHYQNHHHHWYRHHYHHHYHHHEL